MRTAVMADSGRVLKTGPVHALTSIIVNSTPVPRGRL